MIKKINIITFSGVDGAGKTTILREFTEILKQKYHLNVIELRHRPSVLPILSAIKYGKKNAELKTMEVLPRTGTNKSKLSSYLRFFYYLLDYTVGQWIIYLKFTRKNIVVVYDRYYFDFIVDYKRSNINLDSRFINFFYRFIFKPELNFFLYAPPEVILSRKQEMDKESIVLLTEDYKKLFDNLSMHNDGSYVAIENLDKISTIKIVEDYYRGTAHD